jgi:hypothetical protein
MIDTGFSYQSFGSGRPSSAAEFQNGGARRGEETREAISCSKFQFRNMFSTMLMYLHKCDDNLVLLILSTFIEFVRHVGWGIDGILAWNLLNMESAPVKPWKYADSKTCTGRGVLRIWQASRVSQTSRANMLDDRTKAQSVCKNPLFIKLISNDYSTVNTSDFVLKGSRYPSS